MDEGNRVNTGRPELIRTKVPDGVRRRAQELRKTMTAAEAYLWSFLRDRRLAGRKFRRQHPLGVFIADFYCPEARLLVELDGAVHQGADQAEHDRNRDAAVKADGLSVMRFSNDDLFHHTADVLRRIEEYVIANSDEPAGGRSDRGQRWTYPRKA